MKVKNIMFSGFAAAILMGVVAEANAAPVAVASKGYVDSIAGQLSGLRTDDKNNLVDAINELKDDKLDPVNTAGGSLDAGKYYSKVSQATDGQLTVETSDLATTIASGNMIAPTTDAVYTAIQGVSGQTSGLDLLPGVGGSGKFVQFVKQEDGQVSATEQLLDQEVNATTGTHNETAPTTKAVYTAIEGVRDVMATQETVDGKQDKSTANYQVGMVDGEWQTLTEKQIGALDSGITADRVTQYEGYATSKQDKLIAGKFININEETGEITTTYQGSDTITIDQTTGAISATGLQKTLREGNFIDIADDGTITTTYTAGDNITIGTDGKINTMFPEMPDLCSEEGATCVLTSEGGEFAWVALTKPVAGTVDDGRTAQAQQVSEPVVAQ